MSSRTRLKSVSDRESAADMGMRSFYNRTSAVFFSVNVAFQLQRIPRVIFDFREIVVNMRTETEYMIYIICRYAPMLYICAKIVDWKRENGENGGKNEFFGKKLPENLWIQKIVVPLQRFRKQTGV